METINVLLLSAVASFLTMDAVVFGQFGFSRPIVCGPVVGMLVGEPEMGLRIGVILELIWINTIPIGTALVPDVAAASILSVYWATRAGVCERTEGVLATLAMVLALPVSLVFRKMDLMQRSRTSRMNADIEQALSRGDFAAPRRAVLSSSAKYFARNFVLFLAAFECWPVLCAAINIAGLSAAPGLEVAYRLLPAVGVGVFFYNFYDAVFKIIKK